MRKFFVLLVAIIGFGFSANAQDCKAYPDVSTRIYGDKLEITVKIVPAFAPAEKGTYAFNVVVTSNSLKAALNSSSRTKLLYYNGSEWRPENGETGDSVYFTCDLNNNSINQCRNSDFEINCSKR
jgi:hypothetical protein